MNMHLVVIAIVAKEEMWYEFGSMQTVPTKIWSSEPIFFEILVSKRAVPECKPRDC